MTDNVSGMAIAMPDRAAAGAVNTSERLAT